MYATIFGRNWTDATLSQSAPTLLITVRISRIRSVNRKGCIAYGHCVDITAGLTDRSSSIVVSVPAVIADPSSVQVGGIYLVRGQGSTIQREHDRYVVTEILVTAWYIELLKPSGSQLIQWLADNVKGIREVKATKLWDAFGEHLYHVLDEHDHDALKPLIPAESIRVALFEKWFEHGDTATLSFVQERRIPLELARKVVRFHGRATIQVLLNDPYRLLSFEGSWKCVDQLACEHFGVALDDPRRLAAALEASLFREAEHGHTCSTLVELRSAVTQLLRPHRSPSTAFTAALQVGREAGQYIVREANGEVLLHAPGMFFMERECANFIRSLLCCSLHSSQSLFKPDIDQLIAVFEHEERARLGVPQFALNNAQRRAVRTSYESRFSIITGGAGVGKTTVLKALYRVLDTLGRPRFQMALSGRATARMIEATGEQAITIASFLRNASAQDLGPAPIVVVDEASMLDLVTFYRLAQRLPEGTQLVLVGDPYQLPPIGAGLILHELCNQPDVPCTQLEEVKRQAKASLIPLAAQAIRDGRWPMFESDVSGEVAFLHCHDDQILPQVLRLFENDRPGTQILGATRSCLFAGVDAINRACHVLFAGNSKPLLAPNEYSGELEATGFCEGDAIMYLVNDWQRNLQNGSLGMLARIFDAPTKVNIGDERCPIIRVALGCAVFDGAVHYVLDTDIDFIEHAYSITIHKSQGSQFKRVIVPIRKSRLLDRTLVYTAITRAQVQVIMVGDVDAARTAVEAIPRAFERRVALGDLLHAQDQVSSNSLSEV